jgi:hypothetical protein
MSERPRIQGMPINKQRAMDNIIDEADAAATEMQTSLAKKIADESQFAQSLNEEAKKRRTPPPVPADARRRMPKGTPPEGQKS